MEKHKVTYTIYKFLLAPIFLLYYRPKFINKNYIPKKGPVIFCGNHMHVYDQCFPMLSTNRMIHYLAKKEYFDSKFKWFFKSAGCISVNRNIKDETAKASALELLKKGYAVGIFPEGTRNKTDNLLLPFKFGAVSMAEKTNSYIVPFAITGKYKFKKNNLKITFAKPFKVEGSLEEANNKLYEEIKKLLLLNK